MPRRPSLFSSKLRRTCLAEWWRWIGTFSHVRLPNACAGPTLQRARAQRTGRRGHPPDPLFPVGTASVARIAIGGARPSPGCRRARPLAGPPPQNPNQAARRFPPIQPPVQDSACRAPSRQSGCQAPGGGGARPRLFERGFAWSLFPARPARGRAACTPLVSPAIAWCSQLAGCSRAYVCTLLLCRSVQAQRLDMSNPYYICWLA